MFFRRHKPRAPLSTYVDYLWQLRDQSLHAAERVLPTGTLELVLNLAHDSFHIQRFAGEQQRLRGALVSGVYHRYFLIDTRDHSDILGVHFKPGGAMAVLGVAPGELAEAHVELHDLWGSAYVQRLREQLAATAPEMRLRVLETSLCARCIEHHRLHPACDHALVALEHGASIESTAKEVGISTRRLQDLFREQVGTTPKHFARVRRFQRLLRGLTHDAPEWPQRAVAAGYFDQSHLIREFHALAGCAPTSMAQARRVPVKQHHVALP